jgi:hypothetical protein
MNKKDVRIVDILKLNSTAKHGYQSKGSGASNVSKHSSGNRRIIESIAGGTGSSYGSRRITVYDSCPSTPDTVNSNSSRSRITGLPGTLQRSIITDTLNIFSMMRPTSTEMAAL